MDRSKEVEYIQNMAHYLNEEPKLGLALQESYDAYRAREYYILHKFPTLDPRARDALLEDLREEYDRKGIASITRILSNDPNIILGAYSRLRKQIIKPSSRAVVSKDSPPSARELMDGEFDLDEQVEDEQEVDDGSGGPQDP